VRQQFTSKERDVETALDYFEARYYSSTQGRFTGPCVSVTEAEMRLFVREVVPVKDEHYLIREHNRLSIDSASYSAIASAPRQCAPG
jgi:hypothetical protein